MKYLPVGVTAMLLLPLALTFAQTRFSERGLPGIQDAYHTGLSLYYKTWADLNDAQKRVVPWAGDWYRFDVARGQMDLLERTWQDGSFTKDQVTQAIGDLEFVLNNNHLAPRDREVLEADMEQLRDLRLRYGQ
jgi:hypothetical protein